ncbi:MAG: excinuclease ABC subunit UvrC [Candidatus Nanoarchaeia archaeon]
MKINSPLDLQSLPQDPGVYQYFNSKGDIIYVGKAKNLKKRISSYFTTQAQEHPKTRILLQHISKVETIIVYNELEALLLENRLIKKHRPKYNIHLKDDKTYAYIYFSNSTIPTISTTRKTHLRGKYFGPYVNGYLRVKLLEFCVKYFKLITPKTYSSKSQINYEIEQAPAKTLEEIDEVQYNEQVKKAQNFLKYRNLPKLRKEITHTMQQYAQEKQFERAQEQKKLLEIINSIEEEEQRVDTLKEYNQDVVVYEELPNKTTQIVMLHITKGSILKKEEFLLQEYHTLIEWLERYYTSRLPPHELIIEKNFAQHDEIEELQHRLHAIHKRILHFIHPKQGEKKKLLELAYKNLEYRVQNKSILEQIQITLNLPTLPRVIECFDMSNFSYDYTVGGMVQFIDGVENKQGYRKFEIKSLNKQQDDFKAMRECVYRRYYALKQRGEDYPDLIIVDGGLGQLGVSYEALESLGLEHIPLISLAKQEEEIFTPHLNTSIQKDKNSEIMKFIRHIRNSVHNYVVSYNKKKREMRAREEN